MAPKWDKYSRLGLDVASTATAIGFSAAKIGTKLGFSITRGIASTAADLTGSAVDHAFFGGSIGAGSLLGGAVSTAISTIETLALAPILIGESLTSTSLVAAHSTLSVLATIFPGSDEASFSLASFVGLVRREWTEPVDSDGLPEERYGIARVMKALVGWATLQGVTSQWQEHRWLRVLRELEVHDPLDVGAESDSGHHARTNIGSDVHITNDVIYPSHGGQIITADIGETTSDLARLTTERTSSSSDAARMTDAQLKQTLRRLSKMVLAGYGGPSLLFFGVPWNTSGASSSSSDKEKQKEESRLASAVGASEVEVASGSRSNPRQNSTHSEPGKQPYSWWNVLMGRHDHEIFLDSANSRPTETIASSSGDPTPPATHARPSTAYVGSENLMPRFWVLTDHARREVVLVIRGTMSLNELAVDLTCEAAPFELHARRPNSKGRHHKPRSEPEPEPEPEDDAWSEFDEVLESIPGAFPMDISTPPRKRSKTTTNKKNATVDDRPAPVVNEPDTDTSVHLVHGGMLKMARAMGAPGKPVHVAVRDVLRRNRGYSLVLCGHSLGAGVAALLALMWANPYTRLTHRRSGLPQRRTVSAYCFAPPCLTSPRLGKIAGESGLILSFVHSHDVVSRLALGSVRDLARCAMWLCKAEEAHHEGYSTITKRALKWTSGLGKEEDTEWFIAMRKTLEANMQMTELYPPGRVWWALRDGDLHPAHRLRDADGKLKGPSSGEQKVRLFEVLDVPQAFGQIVFARDMLSSHLPHQYDRVLHDLL
ncbi:alpha/beta-hydrolase [Laetiporus sulphureus 93-53]|uniref:sn-1-specific diacylglycerol lipase n=1 Tax=Laetiporus sulphureus 93-53 TaxID=1314785 RepID=A0A165IJW8_9APHY|nr:alpha/beta-hydrolase [Laetiporus sulphureus 93-53]KZT13181.1 alpha/beta-hydrolase [Laetiporus sulphureus 93-53]